MQNRDVVVIGGSLGGVRAVREVLCGLEPAIQAALFVVLHTHPESPAILDRMLQEDRRFRMGYARDGERIENGRVYLAPPDHHMILEAGTVRLTRGARENRARPAIDPLFRSASRWYGTRVIGVLLSGMLDDGVQGLWFVRRRGGVTVVQDPDDAEAPGMPESAVSAGVADHVVVLSEIPAIVSRLVGEPVSEAELPGGAAAVQDSGSMNLSDLHPPEASMPPGPISCPDCNGALWIDAHGTPVRYRCHVGHQFSEHTLEAAKRDELESALWTALRVLKENSAMYGSMIQRARAGGREADAEHFEMARSEMQRRIDVLRQALGEDQAVG